LFSTGNFLRWNLSQSTPCIKIRGDGESPNIYGYGKNVTCHSHAHQALWAVTLLEMVLAGKSHRMTEHVMLKAAAERGRSTAI